MTTGRVTREMYLRASMLWYAFSNDVPEGKAGDRIPDMTIPGGIVLDSMIRR